MCTYNLVSQPCHGQVQPFVYDRLQDDAHTYQCYNVHF